MVALLNAANAGRELCFERCGTGRGVPSTATTEPRPKGATGTPATDASGLAAAHGHNPGSLRRLRSRALRLSLTCWWRWRLVVAIGEFLEHGAHGTLELLRHSGKLRARWKRNQRRAQRGHRWDTRDHSIRRSSPLAASRHDNPDQYRLAAEQGYDLAQLSLGRMYARGEGVAQDEAEAVRWYRLAAERGHAPTQYKLGRMYANGDGVLQDEAEAVRLYRLAAKKGHARAQYDLGLSYANGAGVLKDPLLAHMWLNIAGANGNEDAREQRDILEQEMSRAEISRATELARACMDTDYQECEP